MRRKLLAAVVAALALLAAAPAAAAAVPPGVTLPDEALAHLIATAKSGTLIVASAIADAR